MSEDLPDYAELHCLSAFSFQRGASLAIELFDRARQLGYDALAITDECSMAGIVRALEASRKTGVRLIVGSELQLADGPKLVLLAADQDGYARLCQLITLARRRAVKGRYRLLRADIGDTDGLLALWPPADPHDDADGTWLRERFPGRGWLAVELHRGPDDHARLAALRAQGLRLGLPLVAAGDVHMHARSRRALQDTLTAVRHKTTVAQAGHRLFPNGERHLRSRRALAAIYPPELLAQSVAIAARCTFALDALRYTYPKELVPDGHTPASWLRQLVEDGARWRWPDGTPDKARHLIEHELALITTKQYEAYFLTVHDIVRYARAQQILCQGRGSAANSVVCFTLGITEIDPSTMELLFERFISLERDEPPDIDVDFEHERREEVLQYVFDRYGRDRAALTAVASEYRGRGAIRDVARALGLPSDLAGELAATMDRWGGDAPIDAHLRERGFDPTSPLLRQVVTLTAQLIGFPRHLSQHPGGFVISEYPLSTLVPVENAAMDDRTVIQWNKDDLDTLGMLKVDCLALGMLTAVRKTFALLRATGRGDYSMAAVNTEHADDPATYAMIGRADTVGVFQIESRAQMAMLPRMRPTCFYDLVIEVAIVRPGPIQGDMVHPYLRRRQGLEPVVYPVGQAQDGVATHAGHSVVPGTGDADCHRRGRLQRRRSRRAAPLDGGVEAPRRAGTAPREAARRHAEERLFPGVRRRPVRADQGLRQLRLPRVARGQLRADRLRQQLAEVPPPGRVRLRPDQLRADGVLFARPVAAGRAPARHPHAPAGRAPQRLGLRPRSV